MRHSWIAVLAVVAGVLLAADGVRADGLLVADNSGLVNCVSDCVAAKGEDYEESCKVGCAGKMSTKQVDCGANFKACRGGCKTRFKKDAKRRKACRKSCKQAQMSCK